MGQTVVYTLTSGSTVAFDRYLSAGDVIIALPIYALVVVAVFALTMWLVVKR